MPISPNPDDFQFDCAQKYLRDIQIQFPGWTIKQISEYWQQEGDWASLDALDRALSIVRSVQINQQKEADIDGQQSATPAEKTQPQAPLDHPLPSIVSKDYDKTYTGINWPHYENILKLYALGILCRDSRTPQQQKDAEDLRQAIECVGNKGRKKTHLTAKEIMKRDTKAYLNFGKNVIRAMAQPDAIASVVELQALRAQIRQTNEPNNALQLQKIMGKSQHIFSLLQQRYGKA